MANQKYLAGGSEQAQGNGNGNGAPRLSREEYARRKDGNLCFGCGEAGHKARDCFEKSFSAEEAEETDDQSDEAEEIAEEIEDESKKAGEAEKAH